MVRKGWVLSAVAFVLLAGGTVALPGPVKADEAALAAFAARNALLPTVTSFAMTLGASFGGALVTEVVFNYPGLGYTLFQGITARDYPLIQGQLLIMTLAMLTANFIADVLYVALDPRLRKG